MIYVCIPARDHERTVGLVLWKVRQVFQGFPREYQILVVDDGSQDRTGETLRSYRGVLPMTVVRHETPRGYAASMEEMLRQALGRSDRPRRDAVVTLPADFTVSPRIVPELLKRFESGADLVVGETMDGAPTIGARTVRRAAGWLLRPGLSVDGVRDLTSGVCAIRLISLKNCLRTAPDPWLETDNWCANAELVARVATAARQIATVPWPTPGPTPATIGQSPWSLARELFHAGRRIRIPASIAGA